MLDSTEHENKTANKNKTTKKYILSSGSAIQQTHSTTVNIPVHMSKIVVAWQTYIRRGV